MTRTSDLSRLLDRRTSRRSFLRGAAAASLGAGAYMALGRSPAAAFDLSGAAPPVSIDKVAPVDGSVYLAERVGARRSDLKDTWRPTGHVWLRNAGTSPVTLTKMRIVYLEGTPPQAVEVETPYWKQDTQPVIQAGKTQSFPVAEPREHPLPTAGKIRLQCYFNGYPAPVSVDYAVALYQNLQPGGAYYFPARADDLPNGYYWSLGSNHGYSSNHGGSLTQRFAYDFGVSRFDGSNWTRLKAGTDGSKNEDWLIWGVPVYAMAPGKIITGYRLREENSAPGVKDSDGSNGFWIQHEPGDAETGGFALYAHLMKGSIPEYLVPVEGGPGPNVQRGEFLGLIGNSGNSTNPHLHLHYQRGMHKDMPGSDDSYRDGRPLLFRNIRIREYDGFDPTASNTGWYEPSHGVAVGERMLIDPMGGPPFGDPLNPDIVRGGNGNLAGRTSQPPRQPAADLGLR